MKLNLIISASVLILISTVPSAFSQSNQKRNRGESFYKLQNSNTSGPGNIWVTLTAVGFVWDDVPDKNDSSVLSSQKWFSNLYGFPEIKAQVGFGDFGTAYVESRVLSYRFKFGNIAAGLKLTTPNNEDLRLNGFGLDFKFNYQFFETNPTLGGYYGFMPEGFVVKGLTADIKFLYELDLLPRISKIPLRAIANAGLRMPFRSDRADCFQYLLDAGAVYSRYGFDFFAIYTLEAFNNLFKPLVLTQDNGRKRFAVFFPENPMYLTLGGNLRYDNGLVISLSVPVLLSRNKYSSMGYGNQEYPIEREKYNVTDPFDPWFTKWKMAGSISFPLRYKKTSAEMMRTYLILKNRKKDNRMDIDNHLQEPGTEGKSQRKESLEF